MSSGRKFHFHVSLILTLTLALALAKSSEGPEASMQHNRVVPVRSAHRVLRRGTQESPSYVDPVVQSCSEVSLVHGRPESWPL